jgi:hypothetical protein
VTILGQVLQLKSTVVNRAPVMTAWATIVAERLGFRREEALSIGMDGNFNMSRFEFAYVVPSVCIHRDECCDKGSLDWDISGRKGTWYGSHERRFSALRGTHGTTVSFLYIPHQSFSHTILITVVECE